MVSFPNEYVHSTEQRLLFREGGLPEETACFLLYKNEIGRSGTRGLVAGIQQVDRQYERAHTRIHRMTFNDSSTYKTDAVNVLFLCIFLRKVWLYMWCFIMKLVTSRSIVFGRIEFKLHRQL